MGKLKELALGEGGSFLDASYLQPYGHLEIGGCSINGISDIQSHLNGVWVAVGWLHVVEPALSWPWVRTGWGGMGRAMWGRGCFPSAVASPPPLLHGSQQVVTTWVLLQVPL